MSEFQNNDPGRQSGEYGSSSLNRDYARNTTYDPAANSPYRSSGYSSYGGYNNYNSYNGGSPYAQEPEPQKQKKHGHKGIIALCICLSFVFGMLGSMVGSIVNVGSDGKLSIDKNPGTTIIYQESDGSEVTPGPDTGSLVGNVSAVVQDTVVSITTESLSSNPFMPQYVESGAGSGVIISEDGYIITCNHVIAGADNLTVTLYNGDEYNATVIGTDSSTDLAVIKVEASGLKPATIGSSDDLAIGETAIAVGNPLGTLGHSVSSGIVSALEREVTVEGQTMTLMQTDAAVNPGNSGGGLFDANGALIGIVNAKSSGDGIEGIGFAIPISTAMPICESLMQNGYVTGRPAMGVTVITIADAATAQQYGVNRLGVYVYEVVEGGGAAAAGLKVGDYFVSVDGNVIEETADLTDYLATLEVGDTVSLQMIREGKIMEFEVTLGEMQQ